MRSEWAITNTFDYSIIFEYRYSFRLSNRRNAHAYFSYVAISKKYGFHWKKMMWSLNVDFSKTFLFVNASGSRVGRIDFLNPIAKLGSKIKTKIFWEFHTRSVFCNYYGKPPFPWKLRNNCTSHQGNPETNAIKAFLHDPDVICNFFWDLANPDCKAKG